jgi:hypothetical protein
MATEQNTELQQEPERTLKMRGFRYGLHEFVAARWSGGSKRA